MPDQPLTITKSEPLSIVSSEPDTAAPEQQDDSALGAIGRGLSAVWEQINPVTAVEGAATAVRHPMQTVENMAAAHKALYDKAAQSFKAGDYVNGAVHGLNMIIPLLGPQIDALAERGAAGDTAGMIGGAVGLGLALEGPKAATAGLKAASRLPGILPAALADTAEAASTKRLVDVMAPKGLSKANKQLGNVAEKIAPQIAREPGLLSASRQGLADAVGGKLTEAEDALDAANSARPNTRVPTGPVITDLMQQRARFATSGGKVPEPFADRVSQIDNAIKEVRRLGPTATYDDLKVIRQAYDDRAKANYNAATTPNYGQAMGQKHGAGDVAASIRQRLAAADPTTAEANGRYSLFKSARDVLQATEEIERTKPKVGRQMLAKGMGATTGAEMGGASGALVGYVVGPMLDSAASAGVTTKIATARALASFADAIRSGQPARINGAAFRLASVTGKTAQIRALLSGQVPSLSAVPAAASDQSGAGQ